MSSNFTLVCHVFLSNVKSCGFTFLENRKQITIGVYKYCIQARDVELRKEHTINFTEKFRNGGIKTNYNLTESLGSMNHCMFYDCFNLSYFSV